MTDTYGDTDIIYRNENTLGSKISLQRRKMTSLLALIGIIEAGSGDDVIHTGAGEDEIFGGLGDDRIVVGAGDDTLYGDSRHEAGGRDICVRGQCGTDSIEDFEAAAARPAEYNLADTLWGLRGSDRIIVRLD